MKDSLQEIGKQLIAEGERIYLRDVQGALQEDDSNLAVRHLGRLQNRGSDTTKFRRGPTCHKTAYSGYPKAPALGLTFPRTG